MIDETPYTYTYDYLKGYQQGRADAIDEFSQTLLVDIGNGATITARDIEVLAEQIKEQNNDI